MTVAGIISRIDYEEDAEIDYKLLTSTGIRSIEYIKNNSLFKGRLNQGCIWGENKKISL